MSYIGFVGFAMMILIMVLLVKKKVNTLFAFTIIPIIGAFLIGASVTEVCGFVKKGLNLTLEITMIMFFSLPYFSMMNDTGLFDDLVRKLMKGRCLSPAVLGVITVIVSFITELDGSVTSTFMITIPLLLPLYKRLKMDPRMLVFLCTVSMVVMFNTPWNARVLRSASLIPEINNPSNFIFLKTVPLQILLAVLMIAIAWLMGKRYEKKTGYVQNSCEQADTESVLTKSELNRPHLFWFNLGLTALLIVLMSFLPIPAYFIFALGLIIGLMVNYKDLGLQNKLLAKYAGSLFPVAPAVLLSGVVAGILQESGMLAEMVESLARIIPPALGPYMHIIIGFLAVPLMLIFTNDTWYYAFVPIMAAVGEQYGVPREMVVLTLMMNMGAMISPVAQPQLYLACELGEIELADHIKFSFIPLVVINFIWVVAGMILGIYI